MRGKHGNHAKASKQFRWNVGIISSTGYVKVRVGRGHPLADPNGYAYEHLVVWVSSGRQRPGKGEIIHHKNGDKTDNRIDNLEVMTRAEHNRLHLQERERDHLGRLTSKKTAGRLLDGREWSEFPGVKS